MSAIKNELTLNPDYYSATSLNNTEYSPIINMAIVLKLLLLTIVIATFVFAYIHFKNNSFIAVTSLWTKIKNTIYVEYQQVLESTPQQITQTDVNSMSEVETKIIVVKNQKEKVHTSQAVKDKPIYQDELSAEYIKLMQESLGKY